ncbi:hypothetical protein SAMN05444008_11545 [Cnuella takakiae]|uniref:Trypsin-like peptidase domain-containing protein n=2 Tax=Cnuella takakiae TaxID=1302690 RepID=A0A1M5G077_9BACT|nr:hypothetical protein SAMN05444008_11545 [Cnuella takakiae]
MIACPFLLFAQKKQPYTPSELAKSVVGLETVREFVDDDIESRKQVVLQENLNGKIIKDSLDKAIKKIMSETKRTLASSVFVIYQSKRYLISALHVFRYDGSDPMYSGAPFPRFIRVPSIGDSIDREVHLQFGIAEGRKGAWEFSDLDTDLAVIGLDEKERVDSASNFVKNHSEFANYLEKHGHKPLPVEMIDATLDIKIGEEVFGLGFPTQSIVATFSGKNVSSIFPKGSMVAELYYINGVVSNIGKNQPLMVLNMSSLPGCSGGPIFKGHKLIGILSSMTVGYIYDNNRNPIPYFSPVPLAKAAKSTSILPLIEKLRKRLDSSR